VHEGEGGEFSISKYQFPVMEGPFSTEKIDVWVLVIGNWKFIEN
jgi:hypothetical protein